ncbi:Glycerate kinase [Fusarium oxysporum f. sp. albedinis]|nr:Glycerate kinase [Fusarium oxysporum f. sp. albedinis]
MASYTPLAKIWQGRIILCSPTMPPYLLTNKQYRPRARRLCLFSSTNLTPATTTQHRELTWRPRYFGNADTLNEY